MGTETLRIVPAPPAAPPASLPCVSRETFHAFVNSPQNPSAAESQLVRENPALLMLIQLCQQNVTKAIQHASQGKDNPILGPDGNPVAPKKVVGLPREVAYNLCAEMVFATYALLDAELRKGLDNAVQGR